jgi:hypothetical protein
VRRDKVMRGGLMSHVHNIRQPQDCVSQEGKEDERWDDVTDASGSFKIVSVRRGKKMRGGMVLQMHNTREPQDCV